ncbi:MAG TPA: hypothetical protein VHO70_18920, partial [Chitinispirillaceae bacterium]|nr:hypothetical protein [Chitinispirillaceae bacterium]
WADITDKPSTFTPSAHNHNRLIGIEDTRDVATTTDDYDGSVIPKFKSNTAIGLTAGGTYSTVLGLFGWGDASGGHAHELAFNAWGVYSRIGAPGSAWSTWRKLLTTADFGAAAGTVSEGNHNHDDRYFTETELTNYSTALNLSQLIVGTTSTAANRFIRVCAGDSYICGFEAFGSSQGTGYLYVGQSTTYGGGLYYQGDATPAFATGEVIDAINFYRRNNNVTEVVFYYPYDSNSVIFRGNVGILNKAASGSLNVLTRNTAGSNAVVDLENIGSITSGQFADGPGGAFFHIRNSTAAGSDSKKVSLQSFGGTDVGGRSRGAHILLGGQQSDIGGKVQIISGTNSEVNIFGNTKILQGYLGIGITSSPQYAIDASGEVISLANEYANVKIMAHSGTGQIGLITEGNSIRMSHSACDVINSSYSGGSTTTYIGGDYIELQGEAYVYDLFCPMTKFVPGGQTVSSLPAGDIPVNAPVIKITYGPMAKNLSTAGAVDGQIVVVKRVNSGPVGITINGEALQNGTYHIFVYDQSLAAWCTLNNT